MGLKTGDSAKRIGGASLVGALARFRAGLFYICFYDQVLAIFTSLCKKDFLIFSLILAKIFLLT